MSTGMLPIPPKILVQFQSQNVFAASGVLYFLPFVVFILFVFLSLILMNLWAPIILISIIANYFGEANY